MPAETTISVSNETLEVVKSAKEYPGQSYDELLQRTFESGDEEAEDRD
jgi:hypothetical protein